MLVIELCFEKAPSFIFTTGFPSIVSGILTIASSPKYDTIDISISSSREYPKSL